LAIAASEQSAPAAPATHRASLAGAGMYVLAAQGLSTVIMLAIDIFLFRNLSRSERGTLTAALGLRNVLLYVADMGLALTTVRLASEYYGQGMFREAHLIFRRSIITRLLLTALVIALTVLLAPLLARFPLAAPGRSELLLASAAALLGMTATAWGVDVAQSTRRFGLYFAHQVVEATLKAVAVFIVLRVMISGAASSEIVLWGMAASALLAGGFSLWLQREALGPAQLDPAIVESLKQRLQSFGRFAGTAAMLQTVTAYAEVFIIQWQLNSENTAVFEGARRLAMVLPLVAAAVSTVLLPQVSILKTKAECAQWLKKALAITVPLALISGLGLALLADWIVPLAWGERYRDSVPLLRWLCGAYGILIVITPLLLVLYPLNKLGTLLALNAISLILSVGLGWIMVPQYGVMGAAWSAMAAKTSLLVIVSAVVWITLSKKPQSEIQEALT